MNISLVGIDLAKNVFQVCGVNKAGKVQFNKKVSRQKLLQDINQLQPTCAWRITIFTQIGMYNSKKR